MSINQKTIIVYVVGGGTFTFHPGTPQHGEVAGLLAGHYDEETVESDHVYVIETTERRLRDESPRRTL